MKMTSIEAPAVSSLVMLQQQINFAKMRFRSFSDSYNCSDDSSDVRTSSNKMNLVTSKLHSLSSELLYYIFQYMSPRELVILSQTSKLLNKVATADSIWVSICGNEWEFDVLPSKLQITSKPINGFEKIFSVFPYIEKYPAQFFHSENVDEKVSVEPLEIKYTGPIGIGNRCVRTIHPFPSSFIWERECLMAHSSRKGVNIGSLSLMYKLMRVLNEKNVKKGAALGALSLIEATACGSTVYSVATDPLPFTFPMKISQKEVFIAPRLIGYFEVTIGTSDSPVHSSECIGVGLSKSNFILNGKMPGWDKYSYGYHSDDGGAFHNNGSILYRYGPKFGRGDTVGCGVDYTHGKGVSCDIFFTLNGKFLGVAFLNVRGGRLYPTIGIDSTAPIVLNVGKHEPFIFDLMGYQKNQLEELKRLKLEEQATAKAISTSRHSRAVALCPLLIGAAAIEAMTRSKANAC
mmetsp:Transcript_2505/g.3684  ORF Transcript_2505/g.3684 Transcript_2505/m.3684 type:complete len:461 (+) Transcript_2505:56-1438(+)